MSIAEKFLLRYKKGSVSSAAAVFEAKRGVLGISRDAEGEKEAQEETVATTNGPQEFIILRWQSCLFLSLLQQQAVFGGKTGCLKPVC